MKNYLRTQITLYEEDKNYPIWRRQERRSKYAVQLASWQLRSNSPKMSVRLSVNRSVNHIFRFLHICWQVTGKEWHRVRNTDVSRWLTLGQHWSRWVLLSFHAFVRPSNHPWAWVCVLHTKRLEEMAYNLACWCIQMAYTQHSWMLMDIVVGLSVRPSVRLFVYGIFRWLCICWQITWNKWHKIWHDDVVIIGRWLLPSLVDTGDICCHYWQLILVVIVNHSEWFSFWRGSTA